MIMEGTNDQILVSVFMTTYYHEKYIAQALDSILSQKVNFKYEIVISDDASKDKTQDIIKSYAQKYSFIKYVFNETNIGLSRNVFQAKTNCQGKYLIQLSGDDYWIDDYKMQRQLDFLETHNEYIGVGTRLEVRTNNSNTPDYIIPELSICNRNFNLSDYLGGVNYPLNGFMLRNCLSENIDLFSLMPKFSSYIDDEKDCFLILTLGKIFIMPEATVAYRKRIEEENEHNFNSINKGIDKLKKHLELLNNCYEYFGKDYDFFNRYVIAIGPEMIKNYRLSSRKQFSAIFSNLPEEYRKKGLIIHSLLYGVKRGIAVIFR